ncbi:MAG: hypothetical protein HYS12_06045 [Planctomycetes bacterium]|nr:hypothetical protein [Planctomycetota bacterium]
MWIGWLIAGAALIAFLGLMLLVGYLGTRPLSVEEARRQFQQQREHLEAKFYHLAASSGRPRGLRWVECEWDDRFALARDRRTGQLAVLVGITVRFEAIEGSEMEGLPAVGNLRNASAVFFHERGYWLATGRAVFNLSPDEVLERFNQQFERVQAS